jgi:hypothetical protein
MSLHDEPGANRYARLATGCGELNVSDEMSGHVPLLRSRGGDEGKRRSPTCPPEISGIESRAFALQLIDENGAFHDEAAVDVTSRVPLS